MQTPSVVPAADYIIMTSAAKMPSSCWGRYRNVAICQVAAGARPAMITAHARGMIRIVAYWGRLHVGTTERAAYQRVLASATARCAELNRASAADFAASSCYIAAMRAA